MDLRRYKITPDQLELARDLACRGLICYQPFIFSDDLQTGAAYEFAEVAEFSGMVYCPNVPEQHAGNPDVARHLIDPSMVEPFADYNQRLRVLYENFIQTVDDHVGPISELELADIGCCTGYFPLSFAKRGAKRAVGYDRIDYSPTYDLMNKVLGTNAEFIYERYNGDARGIKNSDQFDVVVSIAVLVHLSDPLQHLAFLGQMARKAILVWTWTSEDPEDDMTIRYHSVNRYYTDDKFPYCFDIMQISPTLLRRSLELMGFTEIHEIKNTPDGMPDYWFDRHRGFLAIRPESE